MALAKLHISTLYNTNSGDIVALNDMFFCLLSDVFKKHFLKIPKFCIYNYSQPRNT